MSFVFNTVYHKIERFLWGQDIMLAIRSIYAVSLNVHEYTYYMSKN